MNFAKPQSIFVLTLIGVSTVVIQLMAIDWQSFKTLPNEVFWQTDALINYLTVKNETNRSIFGQKRQNIEDTVINLLLNGTINATSTEAPPKMIDGCPTSLFILQDSGGMGSKFFQYLHAKILAASMNRSLSIREEVYKTFNNYFHGINESLFKSFRALSEECGPVFETVQMKTQTSLSIQGEPYINLLYGWHSQFSSALWKLLLSRRSELLKSFQWKPEVQENIKNYIHTIAGRRNYSKLVGIHVRLGSYSKHLSKFHKKVKIPGVAYFNKAMNYYRKKLTSPLFLVVSDDMSWCKKTIKGPDVIYAGRGNVSDPGWDLAVLTSCDHLIITYGSFGVMAAYFLAGDAQVIAADKYTSDRLFFVDQMRSARWPNWQFMSV